MSKQNFTENDILFAVATFNANPYCVETDEQIAEIMAEIEANGVTIVTDTEDRATALARLDLPEDSQRIVYQTGGCLFSMDSDEYTCKKYSVYYCDNIESKIATVMPGFKEARFDSEEEAREFIAFQLKGYQVVCPEDNNLDTCNNHHWFEIYDGEPVTIDEDGDEHLNDPIFSSDMVYND
jgi:hypothetical protein